MDILPQFHAPPQEKGAEKMDIYAVITDRMIREMEAGEIFLGNVQTLIPFLLKLTPTE